MQLREYLTDKGNLFFRWRSYTPLCLIPLLFLERHSFHYPLGMHGYDVLYEALCMAVSLIGVGIRIKTIGHVPEGTSGRNTKLQEAAALNVTGMYSVVRNPLYLGNYFIFLGVTLMTQSWEIVVINSFMFGLAYLTIILREEEFLSEKFGRSYQTYASTVPCLIPRPSLWRPPDLRFSMRMVLRREHDTWISTVVVFAFLEHLREYAITEKLYVHWPWMVWAAVSLIIWVTLKMIKKYTGLLRGQSVTL